MTEQWWICTDALERGGAKILGPFESQELALRVREYVEAVPPQRRPDREARSEQTLWVDVENVAAASEGDLMAQAERDAGDIWTAGEIADLRARHPESCWEPSPDRKEACGLDKNHDGLHGWAREGHKAWDGAWS